MKERKNVTWRVAEQSESDKINKWLDKQQNIQISLSNIVLHMINQFGYVNITDYQVQKQLYGKITEIKQSIENTEDDEKDNSSNEKNNAASTKKVNEKDQSKDKNNIYDGVDLDNI